MAEAIWGKVYYKDAFAGILKQEPGDRFNFTYDASYLSDNNPAIAFTLPLQAEPHLNEYGPHPFFDNLIAEGWLESAQARMLGKRNWSRFELLLAFGFDCAGAVSVVDPDPAKLTDQKLDLNDPKELALYKGRASLSGVQPKMALVEEGGKLRPTSMGELSTHIAKFPSRNLIDIIENEYLTTHACKVLLPQDEFVDLKIDSIPEISEEALIIKRFDRDNQKGRIHFEEFNQLLGISSKGKYDGAHKDMADFLHAGHGAKVHCFKLYRRILVGLLTGNTDMHFKNFAMFHEDNGNFSFTPNYDQVSASLYHPDYQEIALKIGNTPDMRVGDLKAKNLIILGTEFGLNDESIKLAFEEIQKNLQKAKDIVAENDVGDNTIKDKLINTMDKRWNGTFASIGTLLSKKQSD